MFRIYKLKRDIKKVRTDKLKRIKERNFEAATFLRDKEKKLQNKIANLQTKTKLNEKLQKRLKSLLYIRIYEKIYGLFIQKGKTRIPVRCEGYPYSNWLNIYLQAIFAEKPLMKNLWEENLQERKKLIEEATEYYLITLILTHLSEYSEKEKYEITRFDVDSLTSSNRYLNLFSTAMNKRKIFDGEEIDKSLTFKYATDENNNIAGLFEEFHYKFQYKCNLKKEGSVIILETPFMILKLKVRYNYNAIHLPIDFCRFYLGFKKNSGQRVNLAIQRSIKWTVFLIPKYWKYIKPFFSLKELLTENFSSSYFFNSFDWNTLYIQSRIIENICNAHKEQINNQ